MLVARFGALWARSGPPTQQLVSERQPFGAAAICWMCCFVVTRHTLINIILSSFVIILAARGQPASTQRAGATKIENDICYYILHNHIARQTEYTTKYTIRRALSPAISNAVVARFNSSFYVLVLCMHRRDISRVQMDETRRASCHSAAKEAILRVGCDAVILCSNMTTRRPLAAALLRRARLRAAVTVKYR